MIKETRTSDRAEWARSRSNIYGFLALLYAQEPDADLLRRLRGGDLIETLQELGLRFDDNLSTEPEEEALQGLRDEYTRLFLGPAEHISPHESVHRRGEGLLWGKTTGKIKRFIERSGLEYRPDWKGIPDHISVELEFMQRLTAYEADAWERGDRDKATRSRELQKEFIGEHLIRWIPKFADLVLTKARSDFYRGTAGLTKEYIVFEAENLSG